MLFKLESTTLIALDFKAAFPELSKLELEEVQDRLRELKLEYFARQRIATNPWVRLTLPLGLLVVLLLLISLPIKFMITGAWEYNLKKNLPLYNWLEYLGLI